MLVPGEVEADNDPSHQIYQNGHPDSEEDGDRLQGGQSPNLTLQTFDGDLHWTKWWEEEKGEG